MSILKGVKFAFRFRLSPVYPSKIATFFASPIGTWELSLVFMRTLKKCLSIFFFAPFLRKSFHPEDLLLQYLFAFNRNQISKLLCHDLKDSSTHPLKSYLHYRTNLIKNPIRSSPFLVRLEKF